jgi:choline dehydrogenase-like flavoprotein
MPETDKIQTEIAVVGSGPGGATVARDLTLAGKKVTILEWGRDNPPTGTTFGGVKNYLGGWFMLGKGILISRELTMMVRGITAGGSSMLYCGTAYDPYPEMWEPFGFTLEKESSEIRDELRVGPLPDDLIGPGAKRVMATARDMGYEWHKLPKFINPENCRPGCNECSMGCRYGAKWHSRDWVMDAVEHGAEFLTNMHVEKVIKDNGSATGVMAKGPGGKRYEIAAEKVIISAGGVGSPMILLRSGITEAGSHFFIDPFQMVCGVFEDKVNANGEALMVTGLHMKDDGIMFADMCYNFSLAAAMAGQFLYKLPPLHKYRSTIPVMVKIRDDMAGKIKSNGSISKPLTKSDRGKIRKGTEIIDRILRKAGARSIWKTGIGAAHPGGTCRMGAVVDENMETGIKNCFVCDASVIPVPFGIPPTLTACSLGRRLSNHILGRN